MTSTTSSATTVSKQHKRERSNLEPHKAILSSYYEGGLMEVGSAKSKKRIQELVMKTNLPERTIKTYIHNRNALEKRRVDGTAAPKTIQINRRKLSAYDVYSSEMMKIGVTLKEVSTGWKDISQENKEKYILAAMEKNNRHPINCSWEEMGAEQKKRKLKALTKELNKVVNKYEGSGCEVLCYVTQPTTCGVSLVATTEAKTFNLENKHFCAKFRCHFYGDVQKQAQTTALTKERDSLSTTIQTYKSLFNTTQQLINELKLSQQEAQAEENKVKAELCKLNITASQINSQAAISKLIKECTTAKENVIHAPQRVCGLQPARKDADVLGKIAHLAEIRDHDIARVLSWHMSADMDCIVTMTSAKAKEIYSQSGGRQQVLPLDSIVRKNLPDWSKPLPHECIRASWRPGGNPIYARNLLTFPQHDEPCRVVFGMLLGDSIIIDTLQDANAYRQEIVRHTHCPTILTRSGDRIRSNGKFGGIFNTAQPIEKLKGAVFSETHSDMYDVYNSRIEVLTNYQSVLEKRTQADKELQEQLDAQKTPTMNDKLQECTEAEEQLRDVEKRLGMNRSVIQSRSHTAVTIPCPNGNSLDDGQPATNPRTIRQSQRSGASAAAAGAETMPDSRKRAHRN